MKLLTKELRKKLPKLYSQEKVEDPIVWVKYFTPWTYWTWYATEFDGEDIFFGYVIGDFSELGNFSLKELESINGPFGLKVERDLWFKPALLSTVMGKHQNPKRPYVIWDDGGKSIDRYTLLAPDGAVYGFSGSPFHPQGFGQYVGHWGETYRSSRGWGRRISINELPEQAREFVRQRIGYRPRRIVPPTGRPGESSQLGEDLLQNPRKQMSMREFIRTHRDEIDRMIETRLGRPSHFKNDEERRQWLLNDEGMYTWARMNIRNLNPVLEPPEKWREQAMELAKGEYPNASYHGRRRVVDWIWAQYPDESKKEIIESYKGSNPLFPYYPSFVMPAAAYNPRPKPPKEWWDKVYAQVKKTYSRATRRHRRVTSPKKLSAITAKVWWDLSPKMQAYIVAYYDLKAMRAKLPRKALRAKGRAVI